MKKGSKSRDDGLSLVNIILKRKEKKETLFYNLVNITVTKDKHTAHMHLVPAH